MSSRTTHGRAEVEDTQSDWRVDLFSNAVEVNPTRLLVAGEEYPYLPMDALSTDSPKVAYVEKRTWNRSSGTRFQNGDVLFARITPSAENGKTALVDFLEEGGKGFGSTEFIVLSPRRGGIEDSRLLYYLVKFERIRNQAIQRMTGSTGRQRIPPAALDDILCPIPPVKEQQKMASILCLVDDAIQKADEIIAKTQQLKKGLMQQLLTKGIGHTKFKQTEIGKIPDQWDVVPLRNAGEWYSGGTPSKSKKEYWGGRIPWISPKDMKRVTIDSSSKSITELGLETGSKLVPARSILVVVRGLILARDVPVAMNLVPVAFNQDIKALVCSPHFEPEYVLYTLLNSKRRLVNMTSMSAHGTKRLPFGELAVYEIPRPQLDEQRKIACVLRSIEEKMTFETANRSHHQALKRGLMQVLLTGKVRVNVD